MAKKKTGTHYSRMGFRIVSLPKRMRKTTVFRRLIASIKTGELPKGWQVLWGWRNAKDEYGDFPIHWGRNARVKNLDTAEWRVDTFENTVANSRGGFLTLMRRRLRQELEAELAKHPKRRRKRSAKNKKGKKTVTKRRRTLKVSKMPKKKPARKRKAGRHKVPGMPRK